MVMQIRRTPVPNNPPLTLAEGQLAVEMATPMRLWCGVPTTIDPSGRKQLVPGGTASGTTPPATGNVIGDTYFNTTTGQLLVWNGTAWVPVAHGGTPSGTTPPATGNTIGDLYFNTATGQLLVWNGSAWALSAGGTASGPTSPTTPSVGQVWYNTTTNQLMVWNGTAWSPVAPSVAGNLVLLMTQTVVPTTPVASVQFFYDFTNAYDQYVLDISNLQCDTSQAFILMEVSVDGTTFVQAIPSYANGAIVIGTDNTANALSGNPGFIYLTGGLGNLPNYACRIVVELTSPWVAGQQKTFFIHSSFNNDVSSTFYTLYGGAAFAQGGAEPALRGVRVLPSTGQLINGRYDLYGVGKTGP